MNRRGFLRGSAALLGTTALAPPVLPAPVSEVTTTLAQVDKIAARWGGGWVAWGLDQYGNWVKEEHALTGEEAKRTGERLFELMRQPVPTERYMLASDSFMRELNKAVR